MRQGGKEMIDQRRLPSASPQVRSIVIDGVSPEQTVDEAMDQADPERVARSPSDMWRAADSSAARASAVSRDVGAACLR
jgi:hypothetical protein